jgi:hypothetical protein
MSQQKQICIICIGLLTSLVITSSNAHAYIDPGSGSMFLQLLLAGIAGAGVAIKLYWRRFLAFFSRSSNNGPTSGSNE